MIYCAAIFQVSAENPGNLSWPGRHQRAQQRHPADTTIPLRCSTGLGPPQTTEQNTPEGEPLHGKALQDFVIDKIDDLKGQDIIALDVQGKSSITDCMIICTGTSTRHVMSIADHVVQESRAAGMELHGMKGQEASDWIVVDLGEVIVHVMQEESRRLYELEKLWS